MFSKHRLCSLLLAVHDLLLGLCLLLWPGLWHELLHRDIERTTFFVPQALGAVVLARSIHLLLCRLLPSPQVRLGHAYLWGAQGLFLALLAYRLSGSDGSPTLVYGVGATVSLVVARYLYPSVPSYGDSVSPARETGGDFK